MASWYAGNNSTNSGNNTGWIFTVPPGGGTLSLTLEDIAITSSGSLSHNGSASVQLDDISFDGSGTVGHDGTFALLLDDIDVTASGSVQPVIVAEAIGGANPWHERIQKARQITEERIRKAKDKEVADIIQSLLDEGVLPSEVLEQNPDYTQVRKLYAAQLAQIAQNAAIEYERITQEEEVLLMMLID